MWKYENNTILLFVWVKCRFNIWGHIATVPACSSGTLTNVLPHRNAMLQTQDMTPTPSQNTDGRPIHWCGTSHCSTQFPILMSWVRTDQEILPRPSTHAANTQLYDAVMVIVSQKLGRKCTLSAKFWTRDLLCANPLHFSLTYSCFSLILFDCLVVCNVPSTTRSFRDGTPIYYTLWRTWSLVFTLPTGNRTPGRCMAVQMLHNRCGQLHLLFWIWYLI